MVSTQHTSFSAAQRTYQSPTLVTVNDSETAADRFTNVLDQLLGKSTRVSRPDTLNELTTKPAEMLYREKEEAPVVEQEIADRNDSTDLKEEVVEKESNDEKQDAPLDSSTISLLTNREQVSDTPSEKGLDLIEHQTEQNSQSKAEFTNQHEVLSNQKQAVAEAFQLVKQVQQTEAKSEVKKPEARAEIAQPLEQLQTKLENDLKAQPEKTQSAAQGLKSSEESDLKIEVFIESELESRDFAGLRTAPLALKKTTDSVPTASSPVVASSLVDKYSAELAKMSSRASLGSKLTNELPREREPMAALSLLGEKSKVQTSKETSKSSQLTSRQEQIINQILKLVDQAAKLKDGNTISIRIKPEELGEVLVKVTQRGDQLFARIIPESKEVEHTVRTGINEVIAQLVSAGFKPDNIHVSVGKELSDSERFSALHNGANQSLDSNAQEQNLLNKGDRHSSSLNNPNSSGSKSDSKNAFSTARNVVDYGWVA